MSGAAGLRRLAESLRKLAEVPSVASADAARGIRQQIDREFAHQCDPYGVPWEEHAESTVERWGEHPILQLTGKMRGEIEVKPMRGAGIAVTFGEEIPAIFHHTGTEEMPARPVLPTGARLPPQWDAEISAAIERAADQIMAGT